MTDATLDKVAGTLSFFGFLFSCLGFNMYRAIAARRRALDSWETFKVWRKEHPDIPLQNCSVINILNEVYSLTMDALRFRVNKNSEELLTIKAVIEANFVEVTKKVGAHCPDP